jgi:serralysin
LNGQLGPDRLTGGAGPDVFVFGTALGHGNVDQLVDFAPADTIDLYHAVFHGLPHGHLAASAFFVGASAHDANDRIVYNRATGALLFDANGSTPGGAIPFATVLNHAALTAADFFVI